MAFCIYCGAKLDEGSNFCTQCGSPVDNTPASRRQEPAPAPAPKAAPVSNIPKILDFLASDVAGEMELGGWEDVVNKLINK